MTFPNDMSQVCTSTDFVKTSHTVHLADIFTLYTAIIYGNKNLAQQKLCTYIQNPAMGKRHIYELIYSILMCVKMEYPEQLMGISIPQYKKDNWYALEQTVSAFCDAIQNTVLSA